MHESKREMRSLLAEPERRFLRALARRLPGWVHSDQLTWLGVLAAFGVAAGYALSAVSPHWLWLASAMLVLNWFGDSLDGTLARVRAAERPRYGYYLDHAVDAFTTAVIGIGIGLSPFVSMYAALFLVIVYLAMSINVYLESNVYGVFRMAYGLFGPTEVRIMLIAINAVLVAVTVGLSVPASALAFYTTTGLAAGCAGMAALLTWRFFSNLRRLARLEPRRAATAATSAREPIEDQQAVGA